MEIWFLFFGFLGFFKSTLIYRRHLKIDTMSVSKKIFIVLAIAALGFYACKPEMLSVSSEPVKDLSGNWQIIKATTLRKDSTSPASGSILPIAPTPSTAWYPLW